MYFSVINGEYDDHFLSYKWKSLTYCASKLGYDWGEEKAHNSVADCKATLYCYNELQKKEFIEIYDENMRRLMELD